MEVVRQMPETAAIQADLPDGCRQQAVDAVGVIRAMPLFKGKRQRLTDWQSLTDGLTKAAAYGGEFEPTIITSVGGYDGEAPLAAPFNVIPSLELASALGDLGYDPRLVIASAYPYAVECNKTDQTAAQANWYQTKAAYETIADTFYPALSGSLSLEVLDPKGLEAFPDFIVNAAETVSNRNVSLKATAERYGADKASYLAYMLSHIQAFRDYQPEPTSRFVIKVGAPSEERFSKWQKAVIEVCLRDAVASGFVPNRVCLPGSEYGQITVYSPRTGSRPVYYPQSSDEPLLSEGIDGLQGFRGLLERLRPETAERYAQLEKALGSTAVNLEDYLTLSGEN